MTKNKIYSKSLILTAILILMSGVAFAAQPNLTAQQILDRVVKALSTTPSLSFEMTLQSGSTTSKARMVMGKELFRFDNEGISVFYDGKTQWTIDREAAEVSITEPTESEITEINPLAFVRNYNKNYNVSLVKTSDNGTYTVKMTAIKKSLYVRSAQVVVSSRTWLPTHVTALLATGQSLNVRVDNAESGSALPKTFYQFDTKGAKGLEVIDLR